MVKEERKTGGGREMKKQYMNPETGSVDDHDGWWYEDETGTEVNGVDQGGLIEVVRNGTKWSLPYSCRKRRQS